MSFKVTLNISFITLCIYILKIIWLWNSQNTLFCVAFKFSQLSIFGQNPIYKKCYISYSFSIIFSHYMSKNSKNGHFTQFVRTDNARFSIVTNFVTPSHFGYYTFLCSQSMVLHLVLRQKDRSNFSSQVTTWNRLVENKKLFTYDFCA